MPLGVLAYIRRPIDTHICVTFQRERRDIQIYSSASLLGASSERAGPIRNTHANVLRYIKYSVGAEPMSQGLLLSVETLSGVASEVLEFIYTNTIGHPLRRALPGI